MKLVRAVSMYTVTVFVLIGGMYAQPQQNWSGSSAFGKLNAIDLSYWGIRPIPILAEIAKFRGRAGMIQGNVFHEIDRVFGEQRKRTLHHNVIRPDLERFSSRDGNKIERKFPHFLSTKIFERGSIYFFNRINHDQIDWTSSCTDVELSDPKMDPTEPTKIQTTLTGTCTTDVPANPDDVTWNANVWFVDPEGEDIGTIFTKTGSKTVTWNETFTQDCSEGEWVAKVKLWVPAVTQIEDGGTNHYEWFNENDHETNSVTITVAECARRNTGDEQVELR